MRITNAKWRGRYEGRQCKLLGFMNDMKQLETVRRNLERAVACRILLCTVHPER